MYKVLLLSHIATATIALPTGLIPILAKKGGTIHRKAGLIYYYAMFGVAISALLMTVLKWNPFLMCLGVFAMYLTYTGKRALWYMRQKEQYKPGLQDRIPAFIALLAGIAMLAYTILQYYRHLGAPISVLQVFGMIQLVAATGDLRTLNKTELFKPGNIHWLRQHVARMGGAYISTVTAFLVVNVTFSPGWVVWLSPTVAGSMLITAGIRRLPKRDGRPIP